MNCEKCLYDEACKVFRRQEHQDVNSVLTGGVGECPLYKSTSDFIEIVRCEDCKYGEVSVHSLTNDGQKEVACYCNLKNVVTDIDGFCPKGERSDTDGREKS